MHFTFHVAAAVAALTATAGAAAQTGIWQYDNNGLKLLQVRFYPS